MSVVECLCRFCFVTVKRDVIQDGNPARKKLRLENMVCKECAKNVLFCVHCLEYACDKNCTLQCPLECQQKFPKKEWTVHVSQNQCVLMLREYEKQSAEILNRKCFDEIKNFIMEKVPDWCHEKPFFQNCLDHYQCHWEKWVSTRPLAVQYLENKKQKKEMERENREIDMIMQMVLEMTNEKEVILTPPLPPIPKVANMSWLESVKRSKRLYLDVPFLEKSQAKQLGARWDQEKKLWYAERAFMLDLKAYWPVYECSNPDESNVIFSETTGGWKPCMNEAQKMQLIFDLRDSYQEKKPNVPSTTKRIVKKKPEEVIQKTKITDLWK